MIGMSAHPCSYAVMFCEHRLERTSRNKSIVEAAIRLLTSNLVVASALGPFYTSLTALASELRVVPAWTQHNSQTSKLPP